MGKYLFLLVVVVLVGWWIAKRYRRRVDARDAAVPHGDEDMVRCAQCGIHLPRSEGLVTCGRYYCSAEHQRQHSAAD